MKRNLPLRMAGLMAALLFVLFGLPAAAQKWTSATGYGGTGAGFSDAAKAVCTDAAGNVYVTGSFNGTINFGNGTPTLTATAGGTATEGFVVKFNAAGLAQWAIDFGGAASDLGGLGIATDGTNVYVTGQSQFPSMVGTTAVATVGGSTDGIVFALSASTGATVWAKAFGGGSTNDAGQAITLDGSGNLYISGVFSTRTSNPTASFGAAGAFPRTVNGSMTQATSDLFVAQLTTSTGTFNWVSTGGAASQETPSLIIGNDNLTGSSIAFVPTLNELVVTGSFANNAASYYSNGSATSSVNFTNAGGADIAVLELSLTGNFLRGSATGGTTNDEGLGIVYDANTAATYITGYFNSASVNGGFSLTNSAGGFDEIFYARYNPGTTPSYPWAKNASGSAGGNDVAFGITSFGAGNVYITGRLQGTTSFPTGAAPLTSASSGADDVFLVKVSGATGNALSLADADATVSGTDAGLAIASSTNNNLIVTGIFAGGTLTFVPSSPTVSITATLDQELFVAQYNDPPPAVVTSVNVPANGTYIIGQNLNFTVNFNTAVTVNTAGGTPYIPITIGSTVRNATYVSGSGTTALVFRYTVAAGDFDNDGIAVGSAITLNGGTIQNTSTTVNATLTLNNVASTANVNVDGVAPTVSSINRQAPPATNPTNATTITYRITFSESVQNVDVTDFVLTATGTATGSIASVSASTGTAIDITVNSVSGNGTLRLDLKASGTGITDAAGNAISGGFTSGQTYTIDNSTQAPTLTSPAANTSVANPVHIVATLPETPQAGSVQLVFNNGSTTTTVTLVNATSYDFFLNVNNPAASAQVASTTGAIGTGNNTVTLRYRDALGNPIASVANANVIISQALPVKMGDFSVVKQGNSALVKWTTASELNASRFELQHSTDGRNFTTVGTVQASGNTSAARSYSFVHSQPAKGMNYYRLRLVDINGTAEFSAIRTLDLNGRNASVAIYPNPVKTVLNIKYGWTKVKTISLLDASGRSLETQQGRINATEAVFSTERLTPGIFFIRIEHEDGVSTVSFMKQ